MAAVPITFLLVSLLSVQELTTVECFPGCPKAISSSTIESETKCLYQVNGAMLKREQALADCKKKYGSSAELTSIASEEEHQLFVNKLMRPCWLGLKPSTIETSKKWDDGTPYAFTKWAPGEPNTTMGYDCAVLDNYKKLWYAKPCDRTQSHVCTLPKDRLWKVFNDFEYHVTWKTVPLGITWDEARKACMDMGGDLLSINTHEQREQLKTWLKEYDSNPERRYWIGLKSTDPSSLSGSWRWSDGMRANLLYWNTSYPRQIEEGARCAYVEGYEAPQGMWFNTNCGIRQGAYICKRPKGSEGVPITDEPPIDVKNYCPTGYTELDGTCVKVFSEEKKTWHEALRACRSGPGKHPDLLSITNKLMSSMVSSLIVPGTSDLWIGGYIYEEDGWGWSTGAKYDYTNFDYKRGREETQEENCLGIGRSGVELGKWNPDVCTNEKYFICQTSKDPKRPIPTAEPQPLHCPTGFVSYNNHCYKISNDRVSWLDANKACVDASPLSRLVTIENAAENFYVFSHIYKIKLENDGDPDLREPRVWLGLQDMKASSNYEWVDQTLLNYTAWGTGQPKRAVMGGCVAMREGFNTFGVWEDKNCSAPYFYMCRSPRLSPTSAAPSMHYNAGFLGYLFTIVLVLNGRRFFGQVYINHLRCR